MAEVGVYVRLPGLAEAVLAHLADVYPGLTAVTEEDVSDP